MEERELVETRKVFDAAKWGGGQANGGRGTTLPVRASRALRSRLFLVVQQPAEPDGWFLMAEDLAGGWSLSLEPRRVHYRAMAGRRGHARERYVHCRACYSPADSGELPGDGGAARPCPRKICPLPCTLQSCRFRTRKRAASGKNQEGNI